MSLSAYDPPIIRWASSVGRNGFVNGPVERGFVVVVAVGLEDWGRVVDVDGVDVDAEQGVGGIPVVDVDVVVVVVNGGGGGTVVAALVVGGTAADESEPTVVEVDEPTRVVPPAPPADEEEDEDDPKRLLFIASCFTLPFSTPKIYCIKFCIIPSCCAIVL